MPPGMKTARLEAPGRRKRPGHSPNRNGTRLGTVRGVERTRVLRWITGSVDPRALRSEGYHVLSWPCLAEMVRKARSVGVARSSLRNPAAGILTIYARHAAVAVPDACCATLDDLRILYGYVLEPAFRAGCRLLVRAPLLPAELDPLELIDPHWRCPWTLERLLHLVGRYESATPVASVPAVAAWRHLLRRVLRRGNDSERLVPRLDREQNAVVGAGDGVVQVIAPAGSGKTTVLVERVGELCRRGTPPGRILCTTFTRDACREMHERLDRVGLGEVRVRSFHGLGLAILKQEGRLRRRLGPCDEEVLERLAAETVAATGWQAFDAQAAQDAVAQFKLAAMVTPDEAREQNREETPSALAALDFYERYERELLRSDTLDLDDLIFGPVRLLQRDAAVRARWQARFERVLVDEYQDIEPAQALLVGLLAAPHDSLFCVGDEDQCIYAWRRATVQRVIDLDQAYPGLERYPLVRNYRCGSAITKASRRLIGHNRIRFRKPLRAGVAEAGRIDVWPVRDAAAGADLVVRLLLQSEPGGVAVLARTGRLLAGVGDAWRAAHGSEPEGFELATVHGSKGREWNHVILYGADEGRFPSSQALRSGGDAGLEDERRLFYVALTRARLRLDIVCSANRPSRFLAEAGLPPPPAWG